MITSLADTLHKTQLQSANSTICNTQRLFCLKKLEIKVLAIFDLPRSKTILTQNYKKWKDLSNTKYSLILQIIEAMMHLA